MIVIPLIIMSSKPINSTNVDVVSITPESHVWKSIVSPGGRFYLHNTETGEVRQYSDYYPPGNKSIGTYMEMSPLTD
tara:strand:- start:2136 stop:2366 length:231 start_codon:yes stop_codon:yes gene_type:complete